MSLLLGHKNGVKARKRYRCMLCGDHIAIGELHDVRRGLEPGDGFSTMRMHPECHAYEQRLGTVDPDWYDDAWEPAFSRAEALAAIVNNVIEQSHTPST